MRLLENLDTGLIMRPVYKFSISHMVFGLHGRWLDQKVSTPTAFEANRPDLVVMDHVDRK